MNKLLSHFEHVLRWGLISTATPASRRRIRRIEAAIKYLKERADR